MSPVLPWHETWFEETSAARDWGFLVEPLTLTLVATVMVVAVAWRYAARRLPSPELRVLSPVGRLTPWIPRLLGIHLGVSLLALAASGAFFTPGVDELAGVTGAALLILEAAVGVWLVSGYRVRPAAVLVLALGPALAVVATSPVILLECANLAAVAAFLVVVPPGAPTGTGSRNRPTTRCAGPCSRCG